MLNSIITTYVNKQATSPKIVSSTFLVKIMKYKKFKIDTEEV